MNRYSDYFEWLEDGGWIRVSARAIIFNDQRDKILVERNFGPDGYANLIGGGVEVDEEVQATIVRELDEETDGQIASMRYLFVVDNFFKHNGQPRHALGHYFEVTLADESVASKDSSVILSWEPIATLGQLDLRPTCVRDAIIDGVEKHAGSIISNFGQNS